MVTARVIGAVPAIILLIMSLLDISGAGAARPFGGDVWAPARETTVVFGDGIMQFLQQMYLQQLGARPSCSTNSSNGGCPRHP
ncbi:hypothetical protein BS78_10G105800 [Paspalum vaginatum]|nr:hypothetical protein BS78_10G105800 [Paspalum vaginatum]